MNGVTGSTGDIAVDQFNLSAGGIGIQYTGGNIRSNDLEFGRVRSLYDRIKFGGIGFIPDRVGLQGIDIVLIEAGMTLLTDQVVIRRFSEEL